MLKLAENGADLIELGVPFSDPIAEGPVIQRASERALSGGTTLAGIFELVKKLRKKLNDTPLLLMMYLNTIYRYGTERFFAQCKKPESMASLYRICPMRKRMKFRVPPMHTVFTTSAWLHRLRKEEFR